MAEIPNKPEWLEKWRRTADTPGAPGASPLVTTSGRTRDENGRWVKGVSGNAKGREPGIPDTRQKLQNAFAADVVDIANVVVEKALDGDMSAAQIVLSRLLPPLRQQSERVQFNLSKDVPLSEQAAEIVLAVSQGLVDSETAKMLIGCLHAVADMKAIENLEARVLMLEAKQIG